MESSANAVPNSDHFDKTRVLDVKPLRSLMPVFPSANQGPPFVCAPPFGPFPSGFSPFYPFGQPQEPQTTPDLNQAQTTTASLVTPLRSYRQPENGEIPHNGEPSSSRKKKSRTRDPTFSAVNGHGAAGLGASEREDGNRELVINMLMTFDALRRRLSQLEDSKESASALRRADLKAGNIVMSKGMRTNMKKRIGAVPGVEIGDIFFFRMEMCIVGLHAPSMAGIDYMMMLKGNMVEEPVATSIVSSGSYDDDAEDPDVLIYTGHGGAAYKDKQASDQKLERGNLALERSLHRSSPVRVTRGMKDINNQATKVYVYDGLYSVKETWVEKGKSGCNTFKYKLVRMPGQPDAFSIWKSAQKWKEGISTRVGLILPDLTSGAESIPVSLVNDVDDEKGPAYFTYYPTVKYSETLKLMQPSSGCSCRTACQPGNLNCSCIRKNGGDFPYTSNGVLACRRPMIYECGPACPCFQNCKNHASQGGIKIRLEVFKTKNRGWGLRSWDPIRAGTFICEYGGEVSEKIMAREDGEDDDYSFDTTRVYNSFKWNIEPTLAEEDGSDIPSEEFDIPSPIIISAKNVGNVSRFMNHSCSPTTFWQPVMYEHNNQSYLHIAFYALRHIPPLTEITYDYGMSGVNKIGTDSAVYGKKKCLCGSPKCRGSFG